MSQFETLMARDGHAFCAYIAKPAGHPRGGVVIVHEIFGLTPQIRRVADSYAALGYLAVAPALFDRIRRDLVLGDSPDEVKQAMGYSKQISPNAAVLDIAACAAMARHSGKVGAIGYCWGGTLTWMAASEVPLGAAVCYYGARITEHLTRTPTCPTLLHFGERDASIPPSAVERIHTTFPQGSYYSYAAGHAFANEDRPDKYHAAAAALARSRTDAFLAQHLG